MGYVYWCAACGNPNLVIDTKKEGYSLAKGFIGAAVLGPVGAIAGIDGKSKTYFHCPKCGQVLSYSMPDDEVNSILILLKNPEQNRNLLEAKRRQYPNMMWPRNWEEAPTEVIHLNGGMSWDPADKNRVSAMSDEELKDFILSTLMRVIPISEFDVNNWLYAAYDIVGDQVAGRLEACYQELVEEGIISKQGFLTKKTTILIGIENDENLIFQNRRERAAEKKAAKDHTIYNDEICVIISTNEPISEAGIMVALTEKHPEINDDNEFLASKIIPYSLKDLVKNEQVYRDDMTGLYSSPYLSKISEAAITKQSKSVSEEIKSRLAMLDSPFMKRGEKARLAKYRALPGKSNATQDEERMSFVYEHSFKKDCDPVLQLAMKNGTVTVDAVAEELSLKIDEAVRRLLILESMGLLNRSKGGMKWTP